MQRVTIVKAKTKRADDIVHETGQQLVSYTWKLKAKFLKFSNIVHFLFYLKFKIHFVDSKTRR